ncbi:MAG: hypothetical protein K9H64_13135 [Bacteroidales bacterium]|nr:hypothetical protein [Bacteroidales bacterium]MCF8456593.1 hypothetical protein [Bacteroidales bacterium]
MINIKQIFLIHFFIGLFAIATIPVFAFDPPPPPPNGGNGDTPPPGGGAPIEGGLLIFVGLATGYAWRKIKQEEEDLSGIKE